MSYQKTTALEKILTLKKRLKIIQGGSSAGKTIAILLILIDIAQSAENKTISVVSETFPHLRKGAIKDFLDIMESHQYYKDERWNKTDSTYKFETGSKIEFFSADSPDKVRGPRRDILFLNEANNVSYDTFTQLSIRTNEDIYIDYNPVQEFWVHTEIINKSDHDFLVLTYKDNEFLSENIIKDIEAKQGNKYFWQVYGLGELGEVEGKIYKNWQIITEVPHEAKLEGYGLDFGYTNDPTAIVAVYKHNGGYILDEVVFQKGLSNKEIADILKSQEQAPIIADSAEPKSIDEIYSYQLPILPAQKGKDSVRQGIQFIQQQRISVTQRSLNVIKEYRNYMWMRDRMGKLISPNMPEDIFNHCMDAVRYQMTYNSNWQPVVNKFYSNLHKRVENSAR